ncbi:hypothetical protein C8R46DRAFT_1233884 [Mycena filopes]|nr:hypothetical protein C8R46DRAFT_1233884 [Mycena filopes]
MRWHKAIALTSVCFSYWVLLAGENISVSAALPPNNATAFQYFSAAVASLSQPSVPAPAPVPAPVVVPPTPPGVFLTRGPWVAGALYIVVPPGPLAPIAEEQYATEDDAPGWYTITKGRYVGVTLSNALALASVVGISAGSMKKYKTQVLALAAFNEMLGYHLVSVII